MVICGPGTRAWDLLQPSFETAFERQTIPELRALATLHVVKAGSELLTEGVVLQALLRELDVALARSRGRREGPRRRAAIQEPAANPASSFAPHSRQD